MQNKLHKIGPIALIAAAAVVVSSTASAQESCFGQGRIVGVVINAPFHAAGSIGIEVVHAVHGQKYYTTAGSGDLSSPRVQALLQQATEAYKNKAPVWLWAKECNRQIFPSDNRPWVPDWTAIWVG